jgi:hypothetical protein
VCGVPRQGRIEKSKGKKVHVKDVHANMKDSEADMIKVVTDGKGDDMDSYKKEFTATCTSNTWEKSPCPPTSSCTPRSTTANACMSRRNAGF